MTTTDQPDNPVSGTDTGWFEDLQEAWQKYDDTGNVTEVADYFADDVVHSPPGGDPVVGKDAVVAHLRELDPTDAGWEIERDDLVVGKDLAVARFTIKGEPEPDAEDDSEEVSLSSVDVFRRRDDGSWKQILSQPNRNG